VKTFSDGAAGATRTDVVPFAALARRPQDHPAEPVAVYLAGLAPSGRVTVARRLVAVARLLELAPEDVPWSALRAPHIIAIRARLLDGGRLAPATVNLTLAGLRGVARAAWRLGLMTAEELAQIRDVPPARGSRLPAGRSATGGELAALLAACARDPSPAGVRDGALLAVLYGGGLRRAELAGLALGDWLPAERVLRVLGKGDRQREVPLPPGAVAALDDWLALRGDWEGPLFPPVNKGGRIGRGRVTEQAVYAALAKRAREAGVDDLSPHDLRRTYVGDLLDAGADIATVQKLAGHADVSTTARYDRRGGAARRAAADLLHVPYARRRP
jgi:integrase/recombinase XerD